MYDFVILGAGVVGAFIARELARYDTSVLVLEKENDVGNVTSNANSAIVHSGYDPLPNTLKAKFNVEGNKMFGEVCEELDVKFRRCGSMTIATNEEQLETLKELKKRADINNVKAKILSKEEAKKLEPHLNDQVIGALYCEDAGVVDPFNLVVHAMENAIDNGVTLKLNEEVIDIKKVENGYEIFTKNNKFIGKTIINATGVNGDIISDMVCPHHFEITPRKGEYYVLDHFDNEFVHMPIFPLPSNKGKGILVTPTSSYNYLVGPSSEFIDDRDDVSTDSLTLEEVKRQAQNLIDNIPFNKTIRVFAGTRPTPSTHDFVIEFVNPNFLNVVGIESPGLVSAPAIGKYVVEEMILKGQKLNKKKDFNPRVRKYVHMQDLSLEERNKLIKSNPKYGHIMCKCELVSEQEMLDALSRSCPPHSIKAMKKRVRAGFGRCQGGMCQPNVLNLMAKFYGVKPQDVVYDDNDTYIVPFATKDGEFHA